jgi:NADPH2:quinone reductase
VAIPEPWLVEIPDAVDDEQAAGLLVQGLTAHALVHRCGRIEPGETVVVQAAGGGTGTLAVQLAKRAGARVIALASSEEKRELATRLGADATADSRAEDLKEAILEANEGQQVDAVFEMTGGATFEACLRTLAPFGRLVLFGIASREQNEIRSGHLLQNSRAVIGFWLVHLIAQRDEVATMIRDLLEAVAAGQLEVIVGEVYPLSEARRAHEDLAGRRTAGKLLLDPSR